MVFKVSHINVRSLTAHFLNFVDYFSTKDYDVIAVSETWLTPNILTDDISLDGYTFLRRDRNRAGRGGGVGIYIKNNYQYISLENNENIEDIWVRIICGNLNLVIGCVYRPPNESVNDFLNEFETSLFNNLPQCDEFVWFGGFNYRSV